MKTGTVRLLLASLAVMLWAPQVMAQFFLPNPDTAVEFRNTLRDQYFLTANPDEIAAIEAGAAGPGWGRTGSSLPVIGETTRSSFGAVHRFYRPANQAHFFTSKPAEVAALRGPDSGWIYEGIAFGQNAAEGPVPGEGWGCGIRTFPVFRLYNNRPGDPGHRYVAGESLRAAMRAKGWIDEGGVFCLLFGSTGKPFESFQVNPFTGPVRSLDECRLESSEAGPCLAVSNVPADELVIEGSRTKFATRGRGAAELASVGPYFALVEKSFRPFAGHAVETQVSANYVVYLNSASAEAGSYVYGHPTLEFTDTSSGLALHFSVLTFGRDTGEFLGRDALTGAVIVGTAHRASSPFIRTRDTPTLAVPLAQPIGAPRGFQFHMSQAEFQRVLDSARQLEPRLSSDPSDYLLKAFRYKVEIAGNGSVDAAIGHFYLDLVESDL